LKWIEYQSISKDAKAKGIQYQIGERTDVNKLKHELRQLNRKISFQQSYTECKTMRKDEKQRSKTKFKTAQKVKNEIKKGLIMQRALSLASMLAPASTRRRTHST
jgi:hypothetical protein